MKKLWLALILLGVVIAVMYPATRGAFKVDDGYVLANSRSAETLDRLFV